ncbi:MAG: alpha/beta hydrolase [Bacteroidota bacterium]
MQKPLIVIFLLLHQAISVAQFKTKQVLVEGKGPTIVLLHGGTFDFNAYETHSKLLADSFTVVRMQQFNVQYANEGRTLPKNYSARTESEAIKATLDSLNITQPVILVGHSYGGVIAFDFAVHHPGKVQALVLVEAPLFDIAKKKGVYSAQMKAIDKLTRQFTPHANISEEMIRRFRCEMANCDSLDIRQHPMWPRWLQQKDRLKGLAAVPTYKIDFQKLQAFNKPVLIVTGTTTIQSNKTIDKLLSHEFLRATLASLPGNHIAIYQNAEVFVQKLKEFISATPIAK